MTTMTINRATVEQALEALELGHDTAKAEADRYHVAMAGFRPERHAQMDAEVQQIAAAITAMRAALAQQAEPVEPVEPHRWEGDHNIESPFNACMHKHYCMSLKAEPVEPYCYVYEYDGVFGLHREFYPLSYNGMKPSRTVPVYTAPPQRKPLTKEEIEACRQQGYAHAGLSAPFDFGKAARAVERAHGITDPQVADRLARHGIPMPEGNPK